jgi:hypothetical protein
MEIKEHRLLLFMELYEKEFGISLSRTEALEKALLLIHYARLFIHPLAEIKQDDITNMRNESK